MDPLLIVLLATVLLAGAYSWTRRARNVRRDPRLEAEVRDAAEVGDVAATRRTLAAIGWGPGSFRWNLWLGRAVLRDAEASADNTRLQEGGNLLLRAYGQAPSSSEGSTARTQIEDWLAPYGVRPASLKTRASPFGPGTIALLALLAAAFLVEVNYAGGGWASAIGVGGIDLNALAALGANANLLTIERGEYWRLFSSLLLHGGLLHVAFNSYALVVFGREAEARGGTGLLLLVFVLGGMAGSLASAFFGNPRALSVGASGAIFALLGFVSVFGAHGFAGRMAQLRRSLPNLLLVFIVNGILIPFVDNWAHGGGLLAGVILGLLLHKPGAASQLAVSALSLGALAWGALSGLRSAGLI
jgi:membrane associated rhomboid family serine protease